MPKGLDLLQHLVNKVGKVRNNCLPLAGKISEGPSCLAKSPLAPLWKDANNPKVTSPGKDKTGQENPEDKGQRQQLVSQEKVSLLSSASRKYR